MVLRRMTLSCRGVSGDERHARSKPVGPTSGSWPIRVPYLRPDPPRRRLSRPRGVGSLLGHLVSEPVVPATPAKHPTEVLFVLLLAGVAFALSQTLVIPALP